MVLAMESQVTVYPAAARYCVDGTVALELARREREMLELGGGEW